RARSRRDVQAGHRGRPGRADLPGRRRRRRPAGARGRGGRGAADAALRPLHDDLGRRRPVSPPPSRRRGAARLAPAWLTAVLAVGSSLVAAGEPPPPSVADDGAASAAHGTTTAARDAPPLASLPDYLAAFAEAYTTPSAERAALAAAREALVSAELDMAPRLALRERLDLAASGPELELGVHLEVPLFDATAAPRTAVAAADVELRNLYAAASREAALAAFLHDLAALAVLSPAADAAARWLPGPEPVGVQAT